MADVVVAKWPRPWDRTMIWIFGTILASLIPPFMAILFYGVDRHRLPSLSEIFGRGDLLVIAIVITIGGFSETLPMIRRIPDDLSGALSSP